MARTREYSRAFTPRGDRFARYALDRIPLSLWRRVRAKAKREGVSIRRLLLEHLSHWAEEGAR